MNVYTILTPITFLYFELLIYFFKLNETGLSSWIYPIQRLKWASLIKKFHILQNNSFLSHHANIQQMYL